MPLITEMFAFVVEESPGEEGIPAVHTERGWMPLVGADMTRVDSIRGHAQRVADESGLDVRLVRFSVIEEVEIIKPRRN